MPGSRHAIRVPTFLQIFDLIVLNHFRHLLFSFKNVPRQIWSPKGGEGIASRLQSF